MIYNITVKKVRTKILCAFDRKNIVHYLVESPHYSCYSCKRHLRVARADAIMVEKETEEEANRA